jgi:hypothetical protein
LRFNFNGQIEKLRSSATQLNQNLRVPLRIVTCTGRNPSLDGNDFTATLAERLTDQRVLVEMWGKLVLKTAAAGSATRSAMVGYVIPPVQRYVNTTEAPALHLVGYPKSGHAASAGELENLPELSAFALVGLGTKAARANQYDLAVWAFTRAEQGIRDAQLGGTNPNLDQLLAYVTRAACRTRESARNDQSYSGALKLVPAENCGTTP